MSPLNETMSRLPFAVFSFLQKEKPRQSYLNDRIWFDSQVLLCVFQPSNVFEFRIRLEAFKKTFYRLNRLMNGLL